MTLGIKGKVLMLSLLPGILIALVLYAYFVNAQLKLLERAMDDHGTTIATQLAPAAEYGVATGNRELLKGLITAILRDESIVAVTVSDAASERLIRVGGVDAAEVEFPLTAEAGLCGQTSASRIFCAPIQRTVLPVSDFDMALLVPPQRIGSVSVEVSSTKLTEQRSGAILQALLITLGVLVVTGAAAVRFGRRISGPITVLTDRVKRVAEGDLSVGGAVDAVGELQTLQQGLDSMVAALRLAKQGMQAQIDAATLRLRTALAELEEKNRDLEEQRRNAQAASAAKGQFLATMSHEIRTPITGLLGMLALLKGTRLDDAQRDYLESLELSAEALRSLIDDILDLSRIEAGKLALVSQPIEPAWLVSEAGQMLAPTAWEKGIELICDIEPNFPLRISGDPLRLRQVLINLAANAVKFTERGEVVVRLWLTDNDTARFEVEDTGIGIPPEKHEGIFESFTQADSSTTRRYGGSGLGTTIARELVQLMGGSIGVKSEPDIGSLFWFELPLREAEPATTRPEFAGRRVFVIEPNVTARRVLARYCKALGMEVFSDAGVDRQAVLQMAGQPLDLVLIADLGDPVLQRDLVARLRRQAPAPQLCLVTHFCSPDDGLVYDGRLAKPVTPWGLRRRLLELFVREEGNDEEGPADSVTTRPMCILVAEDNIINARVIRALLEKAGHLPTVVEDGEAALAALASGQFELAFLDMRMPRADGITVAQRWREREAEQGGHLPLVALTANATTEDREQCLAAGMDDFISKPVDMERLCAALARFAADMGKGETR